MNHSAEPQKINNTENILELLSHVANNEIAALESLTLLLSKIGIRTQNRRISRYMEILLLAKNKNSVMEYYKKKTNIPITFRSDIDIIAYTLREIHELFWILDGFGNRFPENSIEKIQYIVDGTDFAATDRNSKARDTQYELRVASYFARAGYNIDLCQETDVIASSKDVTFYIECKRSKSDGQFLKNISKANHQILDRIPKDTFKHKYIGVIATDVTSIAFPHNGMVFSTTVEDQEEYIRTKIKYIRSKIDSESIFKSNRILLLWMQVHISAVSLYPGFIGSRFTAEISYNPKGNIYFLQRPHWRLYNIIYPPLQIPDPVNAHNLIRRTSISLEAGAEFSLNEDLMREISLKNVSSRPDEEEIFTVTTRGFKHVFYYWDLKQALPQLLESENLSSLDPMEMQAEVAMFLLLQRYPFEGTQPTAQSSDATTPA